MHPQEENTLAAEIRARYIRQEPTELDALKALDRKVKAPVLRFSGLFGTLSALILGSGMSLLMTDLGPALGLSDPRLPGLVLGIAGLGMAISNYPVYRQLLNRRRRKYAGEILALSDRILKH